MRVFKGHELSGPWFVSVIRRVSVFPWLGTVIKRHTDSLCVRCSSCSKRRTVSLCVRCTHTSHQNGVSRRKRTSYYWTFMYRWKNESSLLFTFHFIFPDHSVLHSFLFLMRNLVKTIVIHSLHTVTSSPRSEQKTEVTNSLSWSNTNLKSKSSFLCSNTNQSFPTDRGVASQRHHDHQHHLYIMYQDYN
jgi:hypothetical protein